MNLRKDYEKINKWVKAFESLEKIINEKCSPLIKIGIVYNHMASDSHCTGKNNQHKVFKRKTKSSRKSPRSKSRLVPTHKGWFHGYCFSCNSFGN